ncbi:MAG: serine/threonine-protein kinase, partial [Planctomycetota bacterium]
LTSGELSFGSYAVLRELGKGATGTVYLARDITDGQDVALKVLHPAMLENPLVLDRFTREVELLSQIDHPHIARAYQHGIHNRKPWMAMELINGPSLEVMCKEIGALPEPYVLRLMVQVAQGLDYVERECQLIHRDLKPGNIIAAREPSSEGGNRNLYTDKDIAKIIDFGLAKTEQTDASLTATGMTMGTPAYMSPEQIQARTDLDCRSDIYALGATLYHLLTGQPPFSGSSAMMVMSAHMTEPVPDPSRLVPSLNPTTARLVTTALAKDRDQRYGSHAAFLNACRQAMEAIGMNTNEQMRLLRKPMVLKHNRTTLRREPPRREQRPAHRYDTPPLEPQSLPVPGDDDSDAPQTATDRIKRKYREKRHQHAQSNGGGDVFESDGSDTGSQSATAALAQATRRIGTSRTRPAIGSTVRTTRSERQVEPEPLPPPAPQRLPIEEEAELAGVGAGALPWVVLLLAVLASGALLFLLRG